jgi:TfoX/Sxy family transcriptional regulator of competence genes
MAYDLYLAERVQSILQRAGEFSERKMFGGLVFMVNGHMCCGVRETDLLLRLTPEQAATALLEPHTRPMRFTGRPMKSMLFVSDIGTDSDEALEMWIETALRVARGRPVKKVATRAARGTRRAD